MGSPKNPGLLQLQDDGVPRPNISSDSYPKWKAVTSQASHPWGPQYLDAWLRLYKNHPIHGLIHLDRR